MKPEIADKHIASHTSRRQIQIYRSAHISSYVHILNIAYTSTHNNTEIQSTRTHAYIYTHTHTHARARTHTHA